MSVYGDSKLRSWFMRGSRFLFNINEVWNMNYNGGEHFQSDPHMTIVSMCFSSHTATSLSECGKIWKAQNFVTVASQMTTIKICVHIEDNIFLTKKTNYLTPCSRVLLEKLINSQVAKKFTTFMESETHLSKSHSNIIFPSTPRSSELCLTFRFSNQNFVWISHLSHACYISRHLVQLDLIS